MNNSDLKVMFKLKVKNPNRHTPLQPITSSFLFNAPSYTDLPFHQHQLMYSSPAIPVLSFRCHPFTLFPPHHPFPNPPRLCSTCLSRTTPTPSPSLLMNIYIAMISLFVYVIKFLIVKCLVY